MIDANIYYKTDTQDEMVRAYIEMQVEQLNLCYEASSVIEVHLIKRNGEYYACMCFICDDFTLESTAKSWSPYKAIELATLHAREQILQRVYAIYSYA